GILRVVPPERTEPARALLRELPALDCLDQRADEERAAGVTVLGADEEAGAEEDRSADIVGPGEDRAPGAAARPVELNQAQVELLREARHQLGDKRQRRRRHRELAFFRRVLGECRRVGEQAERDALGAHPLEQRFGDVAALFHHVNTLATGRAAQRVSRRRRRARRATSSPRRTASSAPCASAAKISKSGPRSAAGVSISTTRKGRAAAPRKWRNRSRDRSSSGSWRTEPATSTARFSRHAAIWTSRPSSRSARPKRLRRPNLACSEGARKSASMSSVRSPSLANSCASATASVERPSPARALITGMSARPPVNQC